MGAQSKPLPPSEGEAWSKKAPGLWGYLAAVGKDYRGVGMASLAAEVERQAKENYQAVATKQWNSQGSRGLR